MTKGHPKDCECGPCTAERRTIEARLAADTQTSDELRSTVDAYTIGGTVTAAQYVAAIWALKARGET